MRTGQEQLATHDELVKLASTAGGLANSPLFAGKGFDGTAWQRNVDQWLMDLRKHQIHDQVRVVALMRSFGPAPERGLVPLREAALAQIQVQQADQLSDAAGRLSGVGLVIAGVGVVLAAVQVWLAFRYGSAT